MQLHNVIITEPASLNRPCIPAIDVEGGSCGGTMREEVQVSSGLNQPLTFLLLRRLTIFRNASTAACMPLGVAAHAPINPSAAA
jgi:hypothetical protein|eukprot:COSAG06_NODE_739_length_12671_cov_28.300907_2_plen_84_part_00